MSRVAKRPIEIPGGVDVAVEDGVVRVKGSGREVTHPVHEAVNVAVVGGEVRVEAVESRRRADAFAGTMRAVLNNIIGGFKGDFTRKLELVGVGYRAQAQGKNLNLTLGFSHAVDYAIPDGVKVETPSATEVVVSGTDKQQVGQVAAEIRSLRPPEPYKGKGVRYADENVVRKEAKKK